MGTAMGIGKMNSGRVIFDHGPYEGGTEFSRPRKLIRADTPDEVPAAFKAVEAARSNGEWLAGYASYELGYCLGEKLRPFLPENRRAPLMLFGVFDQPRPHEFFDSAGRDAMATISALEPLLDFRGYQQAFRAAHDYIRAGDVYQVNLTFPMQARSADPPDAVYQALRMRQPVGHGALVDLGWPAVLSRSPELFFRVSAEGEIETRPMKGTIRRGRTEAEDALLRAQLACSQKDRAENLMIVDLLRNDISRIARPGSVRVPELFEVETYETVHQMVSQVSGQVPAGVSLESLFSALFPCGSITGAPKIRAMEIIAELEQQPRDVYCGAIGWLAPDGRAEFSVAIRTLMMDETGAIRMNVGGGVVYDSSAAAEYEEAMWKARFASLPG